MQALEQVEKALMQLRPSEGPRAFVHFCRDVWDLLATDLLDERFVCVLRKGHPLADKRLTLDRFCAASHALVAPRGKPGGYVDEALARLGRNRRVALAVPHFLVVPHVVIETDLIVTLAERVAQAFSGFLPLITKAPPIELTGFTMRLAWHERTGADPGHAWLRATLKHVADDVRGNRHARRGAIDASTGTTSSKRR